MDDNATRERLVVRKLPSSSIFIAPIAKLKWNRINGLIKKYQFKHGSLIFPVPTSSPPLLNSTLENAFLSRSNFESNEDEQLAINQSILF